MSDETYLPISELSTIEEVITWLKMAQNICADTAVRSRSWKDRHYLDGRAAAYALAVQLIEKVTRGGGRS